MDRKKKIALGLTAAALAAAAGRAMTEYVLRVAVDRNAPPAYMRQKAERESGSRVLAALEDDRERLRKAPHQVVTIRSQDGLRLVGHWFPHPEARRVILAAHGWRSLWFRDFCGVADFWRQNNCSVLYIEQRAQGSSEGERIGFGMLERFDCQAWLHWIVERCGGEIPVYLAGISMGAATVLMAADLPLPGNVRGIMADCGFTSADAIWRHVARKQMHFPYALMKPLAVRLCRQRLGMAPDACSTTESLRRTSLPVLLIHGEDDHFVPVEMTYENYAACAGPKRLLVVPGATHGMSCLVQRDAYEAAELAFWDSCDGAAAG